MDTTWVPRNVFLFRPCFCVVKQRTGSTTNHQLASLGQVPPLRDWQAFVQALTDAFRPVELERKYYGDLFSLKQGKSDIRQYIATFNAMRAKTPGAFTFQHFVLFVCTGSSP
jgi:hypothetical protein